MRKHLVLFVLLVNAVFLRAQDTLVLTLADCVRLAREVSVDALIAENQFNNAFWNFRSWQAARRPVLALDGTLPRFDRTILAITQPDGSDLFIQRNQVSSSLNLSLSQEIGFTGGRIFAGSGLQRIDLLGDSTQSSYLSSPFFIGWQQPIFRYNDWQWRRQIEPLKLDQADRVLLESIEEVSIRAVSLFFQLHLAQINRGISATNLANNDTIYKISRGRYNLGKIAENDLLQVELSVLNAQVALAQAENEIANTEARLKRFLRMDDRQPIRLEIPSDLPELRIDPAVALEHARKYRSDVLGFQRQQVEAEQQVAVAKGNNGFSADLFAQYGLNNTAVALGDAYQDPQNFQNVGLTFSVPIVDWGRARSEREIAFANRDLVQSQIELNTINFEQEVILRVQQFNLQSNQVRIAAKADTVSHKRFDVAKARYLIGKTDITDLNIANSEQDQARRAYIAALLSYWNDYYTLRRLTLYDYQMGRPLGGE